MDFLTEAQIWCGAKSQRRLLVYGGQEWTGEKGQLLNDVWIWTPPPSTGLIAHHNAAINRS